MKYSLKPVHLPLQQLYVRVCSRLLDCRDECKRLWYLLRSLDPDGRGWAEVERLTACEYLDCSLATLYRLIEEGLAKGWLRSVERFCNVTVTFRIYYGGIKQVCLAQGIQQLGGIAWTNSQAFTRAGAKAVASELEALQRQSQAHYSAHSDHAPHEVLDASKIMASSVNSSGASRYVFTSGTFVCPGASHSGIARPTEWTASTIKRRLDNRWRISRGVSPVQKRRVAHKVAEGTDLHQLGYDQKCFVVDGGKIYRTFANRSGIYQLKTNIYGSEHELLSCRFLRSRISECWRGKGRGRNSAASENGVPSGLAGCSRG